MRNDRLEVTTTKTILDKINPPYSLHDMNVIAFEVDGTANLSTQVDGYVEFHDVDIDFSYVYIYNGFCGNVGTFSGEKMFLKDFINSFENAGFSIMDENYGFNRVCYTGFLSIYLVPAEVAADLDKYCWDFAANWVWHGPENGKFLKRFGDSQFGAVFGALDFIDYLNKWVFPDYESRVVKGLGCYGDEIPEEYQKLPRYNF